MEDKYELDRLPAKCANNYIFDETKKEYRTNIYSVDAAGTGAGGAFTTVRDIISFWNNLLSFNLLSEKMTKEMLSKQSGDGVDKEESYYGLGVWLIKVDDFTYIPYFQGMDPGVSFFSEFNAKENMISVFVSNYCDNVWEEMRNIRKYLYTK